MTRPTSTSRHCMHQRRLTAAVEWVFTIRDTNHGDFEDFEQFSTHVQKWEEWISDLENRRYFDHVVSVLDLIESLPPEVWKSIIEIEKYARTQHAVGQGSRRGKMPARRLNLAKAKMN